MFIVKNTKNNNYYQKTIFKGQYHFVMSIEEAKRMRFETAQQLISRLPVPEDYEIVEVKSARKIK
jgi:hypothetical protein